MKVTRTSVLSGVRRTMDLDVLQEQLDNYHSGRVLLQDAFPHLGNADREFIKTGITEEEWNEVFPDDELEDLQGT